MKDRKVNCSYLWQAWSKQNPNSKHVLEAKKRMSKYKKADWQDMILDAEIAVDKLKILVTENIDPKTDIAQESLDYLGKHINKYFFNVDKEYLTLMAFVLRYNKDHRTFFDAFQPGLADKMILLVDERLNAVN